MDPVQIWPYFEGPAEYQALFEQWALPGDWIAYVPASWGTTVPSFIDNLGFAFVGLETFPQLDGSIVYVGRRSSEAP